MTMRKLVPVSFLQKSTYSIHAYRGYFFYVVRISLLWFKKKKYAVLFVFLKGYRVKFCKNHSAKNRRNKRFREKKTLKFTHLQNTIGKEIYNYNQC